MGKRFSEEENNIIKKMFPDKYYSYQDISNKINVELGVSRTCQSIRVQGTRLGLHREKSKTIDGVPVWSKEDVAFLHDNYAKMTARNLAKKLNKTTNAIYHKLDKEDLLGTKTSKVTTLQIKQIQERYAVENTHVLAAEIGVNGYSISAIASNLNIRKTKKKKKCRKKMNYWTEKEDMFLMSNSYKMTPKEISKVLITRTSKSIIARQRQLLPYEQRLKSFSYYGCGSTYISINEKERKMSYAVTLYKLFIKKDFKFGKALTGECNYEYNKTFKRTDFINAKGIDYKEKQVGITV